MKKLAYYIGILVLLLAALSFWGFYSAIRPVRIYSKVTPKNFGVTFEKVAFQTSDQVTIRGWFVPSQVPSKKVIILLHGYPMDKGDILPSRLYLWRKYNLLFIDFRYLGESGGRISTVGKDEVLDVVAAVKFLQQRGFKDIGIWGFSLGGAVALMAAQHTPEVKAVVAEASYAKLSLMAEDYFRYPILRYPLSLLLQGWSRIILGMDINSVSPVDAAMTLNMPVLIINSRNDAVVPLKHADLFKAQLSNKKNIELLLFDNVVHGASFEGYEKVVESFFDKNM